VLTVLAHIFRSAGKAGIPVSVCGEMAGDVALTRLLLGLGLRQFSMHSAHLPDVKQRVLKTTLSAMPSRSRVACCARLIPAGSI
jgi:phosphoenolpyruvate-protein phosphotransferase (PTS system enzyme I)